MEMILLAVCILVVGLAVLGLQILAFGQDKRLVAAVNKLTAVEEARHKAEQQRHMDSLRVQRGERLKTVQIAPVEVGPRLSEIVSKYLSRPVTLDMALSVTTAPVPAMEFNGEKEDIVLTTNADAYVDLMLRGSGRVDKTKLPQIVEILPTLDELVVDEEIFQCYEYFASKFQRDVNDVPRVPVWHAIVLPDVSENQVKK